MKSKRRIALEPTQAYTLAAGIEYRVPTSSGDHGKPGKSLKKVPCMEKSWNLKKSE